MRNLIILIVVAVVAYFYYIGAFNFNFNSDKAKNTIENTAKYDPITQTVNSARDKTQEGVDSVR